MVHGCLLAAVRRCRLFSDGGERRGDRRAERARERHVAPLGPVPPRRLLPTVHSRSPASAVGGAVGRLLEQRHPREWRRPLPAPARWAIPDCPPIPEGEPDRGWQLDFQGGFFGQFDIDHSLDNIGWDGLFGLRLAYKGDGPLVYSLGLLHDSAHVGDEYADRTGRKRISYTREEVVLGTTWAPSPQWQTYLEIGWGYGLKEFQDPLRIQLGVVYFGQSRLWQGRIPWYAALDTTVYQENDRQARTSAQLGLMFPTGRGTSRYRLALEMVTGRSVLGEFSMYNESYIGLGWYFDL